MDPNKLLNMHELAGRPKDMEPEKYTNSFFTSPLVVPVLPVSSSGKTNQSSGQTNQSSGQTSQSSNRTTTQSSDPVAPSLGQLTGKEEQHYENSGKKWTSDEVKQLVNELREKKNISEIANIHKRTYNSIQIKIHEIIVKYYNNGKTIEHIHNMTNLEKSYITFVVEKNRIDEHNKPADDKNKHTDDKNKHTDNKNKHADNKDKNNDDTDEYDINYLEKIYESNLRIEKLLGKLIKLMDERL